MKVGRLLLAAWLGLVMAGVGLGQTPPPNDNFSNRTVLIGNDVTFSGTLAGATIESPGETAAYGNMVSWSTPTMSVWWSWTASTDTVLTLQILAVSPTNRAWNVIFVHYAADGNPSPDGPLVPNGGYAFPDDQFVPQTLSFPVTNGTDYQIQLIGDTATSYSMRLMATNAPLMIRQPRSQAVYSNASAMFYPLYTGDAPASFNFQWFFNGTPLSGEDAPILALTNVDGSMAGAYTVAISNAAGYAISEPATLTVSQSNVLVALTGLGMGNNAFKFSVSGELGRSYRLQSSLDLINWVSEPDFLVKPALGFTSIFFDTGSPLSLSMGGNYGQRYFRATPYIITGRHAEICINNLRQIRIAKELWRRANRVPLTSTPQASDILPYLAGHVLPVCPDDSFQDFSTSYVINGLLSGPDCKIVLSHILEDPQ